MRWTARYLDGSRIDSPQYGRIDRSRAFRFDLYANTPIIEPFLKIPVPVGKRLVHRTRRVSAGGVLLSAQAIVALESEDRSEAEVWVITDDRDRIRWVHHDGYSAELYPPDLLEFEDVIG